MGAIPFEKWAAPVPPLIRRAFSSLVILMRPRVTPCDVVQCCVNYECDFKHLQAIIVRTIFIFMTNLSTSARIPRATRALAAAQPLNNRSRVSTGRTLFANSDGRSLWARRFRDLLHLHCDDLGGASTLSECQLSLVRRLATLEISLEHMEGELAEGREVNLDVYGRLSGHLRRLVETLGARRVKREVVPTIHAYVRREREREQAEANA
jgi:hypothetical protein